MNPSELQHEVQDAPPRLIAGVAAAIMLALALFWGATQLWYRHEIGGQARAGEMQRQTSFSHGLGQRLPILVDRAEALRESDANLHASGSIDPSAGVARIPIERAMQLVAQEQLKTRPPIPAAKPLPSP